MQDSKLEEFISKNYSKRKANPTYHNTNISLDWFQNELNSDNEREGGKKDSHREEDESKNDILDDNGDYEVARKTKIMCTIGKITNNKEAITKLLNAGMDVARINMAFVNNKEHKQIVRDLRKMAKETKRNCGIMMDLKGNVVRTGTFKTGYSVSLKEGQEFRITSKKILGDHRIVSCDYHDLANKVKIGQSLVIDYGQVCMTIIGFENEEECLEKIMKDQCDDVIMSPERYKETNIMKLTGSHKSAADFDTSLNLIINDCESPVRINNIVHESFMDEQKDEHEKDEKTNYISIDHSKDMLKEINEIKEQKDFEKILEYPPHHHRHVNKTPVKSLTPINNTTPNKLGSQRKLHSPNKSLKKLEIKQSSFKGLSSQRPSSKARRNTKEKLVIVCKVEFDCELGGTKPIYFPDLKVKEDLDLPIVGVKDIKDLHSGIKLGVDYIAVPYIETKDDILEVKELLSVKGRNIKIIPKIQNRNALKNFDEILEVSDGIIIARGYLGLEVNLEHKHLIKKCSLAGKPVILATQIMDSMVTRLRPTRAEVSDISNAVFDGIDCLMLSPETASGLFFEESVQTMSRICSESERNIKYEENYETFIRLVMNQNKILSIDETISSCAVKSAFDLKASLIVVFTYSGATAKLISKYKPKCPILAITTRESSAQQCLLHKGIFYMIVGSLIGSDALIKKIFMEAKERNFIRPNSYVIVTTGVSEGIQGNTNLLKIFKV